MSVSYSMDHPCDAWLVLAGQDPVPERSAESDFLALCKDGR